MKVVAGFQTEQTIVLLLVISVGTNNLCVV